VSSCDCTQIQARRDRSNSLIVIRDRGRGALSRGQARSTQSPRSIATVKRLGVGDWRVSGINSNNKTDEWRELSASSWVRSPSLRPFGSASGWRSRLWACYRRRQTSAERLHCVISPTTTSRILDTLTNWPADHEQDALRRTDNFRRPRLSTFAGP